MLIHFLQRRDPPILPSLQDAVHRCNSWWVVVKPSCFLDRYGLRPDTKSDHGTCKSFWQDIAFSHNEKPKYINGVDCRQQTYLLQVHHAGFHKMMARFGDPI